MLKIKDFKENTKLTGQSFLIKTANVLQTRTGKDYLNLTLADNSDEINAKIWNVDEDDKKIFVAGKVCVIDGTVTSYNGHLQISTDMISTDCDQGLEGLVKSAPEDKEALWQTFKSYLDKINNDVYRTIVNDIFDIYGEKFLTYPAAKRIHHNYNNGLLEHTVAILKLVDNFASLYPNADRDLLYAGAILHDMGKVIEYSGVIGTEKTTPGMLLGHISIVDGMICQSAIKSKIDNDDENLLLLRHVVLAHHGKLEFGSPVEPQIIEAVLLNKADDLDAEMNTLTQAENKVANHAWTEKVFSEGNRQFFKHNE